MKITNAQFDVFFKRYIAECKITDTTENRDSFRSAIEFIEEFGEDYINCAALGSSDEKTVTAHSKDWKQAVKLLNDILSYKQKQLTLKSEDQLAVTRRNILNSISRNPRPASLHAQTTNLSIANKYQTGTLQNNEWLTDGDLRQMLAKFEITEQVQIKPFARADLGMELHFKRLAVGQTNQPYTIHFLFNKGSGGMAAGIHWLTGKVEVDPIAHSIRYEIIDSQSISPQQKTAYKKIIEDAIRYEENAMDEHNKPMLYAAFPNGWSIDKNSFIIGQDQPDGYSCGYRALHNLVQDRDLVGNAALENYRGQPADSNALVQTVYTELLPNDFNIHTFQQPSMRFRKSSVESYAAAAMPRKPTAEVDQDKKSVTQDFIPKIVETITRDVNSEMVEALNAINEFTTQFTFDSLLNEQECKQFLNVLQTRLKKPLKTLEFPRSSTVTLNAINAYLESDGELLTESLSLELDSIEQSTEVLELLKRLLVNLDQSQVKLIKIKDDFSVLDEAAWQALEEFIREKGTCVAIDLPEKFQNQNAQRVIDSTISNNQRRRNIAQLAQEPSAKPQRASGVSAVKIKRTRPRKGNLLSGLTIDTEMQQEVQAEVEATVDLEDEKTEPRDGIEGEDLPGLITWLKNGKLKLDSGADLLTIEELENSWRRWMGDVVASVSDDKTVKKVYVNKRVQKVTPEAAEQLLNYRHLFQDGLDFDHLPPGFIVIPELSANIFILHYEKNNTKSLDKITPKLNKPAALEPMAFDMVAAIMATLNPNNVLRALWDKLMSNAEYNREQIITLRRYLLQLLRIDPASLLELFDLCKLEEKEGFDSQKLSFFLDHYQDISRIFSEQKGVNENNEIAEACLKRQLCNTVRLDEFETLATNIVQKSKSTKTTHPLFTLLGKGNPLIKDINTWIKTLNLKDQQLDALSQVYLHYSEEGLRLLLASWQKVDGEILKLLHNTVFKSATSFVPLLQSKALEQAYIRIAAFKKDPNQYAWWKILLEQHANAVGYDDLPALVDAFYEFSEKIDEYGLKFYSEIHCKDVSSLPTVLARMLSILKRTNPEDRQKQWECISRIPLSSSGAVRAMLESKPHFVVPEMHTYDDHYDADLGYGTEQDWKKIALDGTISFADNPLEIETTKEFRTLAESKERMYRFMAHQSDSLPLGFYQTALKKIESNKNFSDPSKDVLCAILAKATCGRNLSKMRFDSKQMDQDWAEFIKWLSDMPLPTALMAPFRGQFRKIMILSFFVMEIPPPLPVLKRLADLIASALVIDGVLLTPGNLAAFIEKMDKLSESMTRLDMLVQDVGDDLYDGMRLYTPETYKEPGESIFHRHLAVARKLSDTNKFCQKGKVGVISQFALASSDEATNLNYTDAVNEACTALRRRMIDASPESSSRRSRQDWDYWDLPAVPKEKEAAVAYALKLMADINKSGLNHRDLCLFFNNFPIAFNFPENKIEIENWLKDIQLPDDKGLLKDYFPEQYFEQLQAKVSATDIYESLLKSMSDEEAKRALTILEQFKQTWEGAYYRETGDLLVEVSRNLPKESRLSLFQTFIDLLNHEPSTIADFMQLLRAIRGNGSVQQYLYFLNKSQTASERDRRDLLPKIGIYLEKILPLLRSAKRKATANNALLKLAIDRVLASDITQLDKPIQWVRQDQDLNYQVLDNQLVNLNKRVQAGGQEELIAAIANLDILMQSLPLNAAKFKNLEKLKAHVHDLCDKISAYEQARDAFKQAQANPTPTRVSQMTGGLISKIPPVGVPFFASTAKPTKGSVLEPLTIEFNQPLLNDTIDELKKVMETELEERKHYPRVIVDLLMLIDQVVASYPADKKLITEYLKTYLYVENHEPTLQYAWNRIELLSRCFIELKNVDVVRSLCTHFTEESGDYTFESLYDLLNSPEYQGLNIAQQRFFLKLISILANNGKRATSEELLNLIRLSDDGSYLIDDIQFMYSGAPYPDLEQIGTWVRLRPQNISLAEHLRAEYTEFDKAPCAREAVNGFDLAFARAQSQKITGMKYRDGELETLNAAIQQARDLSTAAIQKELNAYRNWIKAPSRQGMIQMSHARLTALLAELLYRTKGMPHEFDAVTGRQKLGRSFEIHTTQYLAIYSMLKSGRHVTAEIGTGEGKSRIMMLMIGCQYVTGHTVDFVTSDLDLATRDYLTFKSFFDALGAKSNLIYQDTPTNDYLIDGINFSDAANLSLFRNKVRSEGHADAVIDPVVINRALLLDEADRAYFDLTSERFNYSGLTDPSIQDMPWVYDLLVGFFLDNPDIRNNLYYDDIDECTNQLKIYAYQKFKPEQASRLENLSQAQLEIWQESAIKALSFKLDENLLIESPYDIQTKQGPRTVSKAYFVKDGRKSPPSSNLSHGVQQCLNALLNRYKREPELVNDPKLREALAACEHDFFIDDEKQIIYSSSSKSMLDEYNEGVLYGVTGTSGSIREREEAKLFYSDESLDADADRAMRFINIPRHKGLHRVDNPILLAKDAESQRALFLKQILEARANNQPILLVCKDDAESKRTMEYLQQHLPDDERLQCMDAGTSSEEHTQIVSQAGQPGMITVATAKIGRGTDIPLHGEANQFGMRVLVSYLPRGRDYWQIVGRSGRFGAKGDTRLVLNKTALKEQFNKSSLKDGYYTATEAYIKQQQAIMDRRAQVERLVKYVVSDFRVKLTRQFFEKFWKQVPLSQYEEVTRLWKEFYARTDKKWNSALQNMSNLITNVNPDYGLLNVHLAAYQVSVQESWTQLLNELQVIDIKNPALEQDVGALMIAEQNKAILKPFKVEEVARLHTTVYDKYDPAHDGKATIYTGWFVKLRATLAGQRPFAADLRAWWNGHGILFANTRALFAGHMTLLEYVWGGSAAEKEKPDTASDTETVDSDILDDTLSLEILETSNNSCHN